MNRDQLLVAVLSAVALGGAALAWSGLHPRHRQRPARALDPWPVASAVIVTAAVFAVSGWPLPALVGGVVAGWFVHRARRSPSADAPASVEALASWVEAVRDVLQAAGQPIGAIGATAETAPVVIRQPVRRLFARLSAGQPAEWALRAFADELDDPLGDLVAVGLLIAVSRGAQTDQVLSALAAQARHQADRRRLVDAERAPMRHQVLAVSAIMCLLLVGVFVFGRSSFLDVYDTAHGQVVLAGILVGYAALLSRVARLTRFPLPSRFLTARGVDEVGR